MGQDEEWLSPRVIFFIAFILRHSICYLVGIMHSLTYFTIHLFFFTKISFQGLNNDMAPSGNSNYLLTIFYCYFK